MSSYISLGDLIDYNLEGVVSVTEDLIIKGPYGEVMGSTHGA